ncbi:MAG: glycosyltransferase [Candidatus Heimdallarchaeaceae archaeon]
MEKVPNLLGNYLDIEKGLEVIYIHPSVLKQKDKNSYLYLLYKPVFDNKRKFNFSMRNVSFSIFPLIVFRKLLGEKSILHHHWYEFNNWKKFLLLIWKTFWMLIYSALGGKIVWTVHNKYPHKQQYLKANKILRKFFAKIAIKLHVHCQSAIKIMGPILGVSEDKFFVLEHPLYPSKIQEREEAIKILNSKYTKNRIKTTDLIFLMFGQISHYKGIREVEQVFNSIQDKNKKLIIAGKTKKNERRYSKIVENLANQNDNILCFVQNIPDEDIPLFFNSSDYIIFNYKDVLTSGAVFLALSYNKKIITNEKGCLKDLKGDNVIKFNSEEELKKLLSTLKD